MTLTKTLDFKSIIPNRIVYDITRTIIWLIAKIYHRIEIKYLGEIPSHGGFILAPVHRSNLDPPFCSLVTKRRLCFLAKKELFSNGLIGNYLRTLGAFPIRRGESDLNAFKNCLAILKEGHGLVIFPEGTRKRGQAIEHIEDGAIRLAQRTQVPVVPVAIAGSEAVFGGGLWIWHPKKIRIVIGAPIAPSELNPQVLKIRMQELVDCL